MADDNRADEIASLLSPLPVRPFAGIRSEWNPEYADWAVTTGIDTLRRWLRELSDEGASTRRRNWRREAYRVAIAQRLAEVEVLRSDLQATLHDLDDSDFGWLQHDSNFWQEFRRLQVPDPKRANASIGSGIWQWVLAAAGSGVIGSLAVHVLKDQLRRIGGRLRSSDMQRPYVKELARLAVAAKLDSPTTLDVVEADRHDGYWLLTVKGGGKVYRVRVPLDNPSYHTISVDLA